MGIFDKFKKKKDLWEEAYQAKARIYGKEDESPVMVFTLTETVDTILPMDPANMYETEQEIGDYRLCFVSLKNNGEVIADLPFYACISQLSNYVIEQRNPFVLIKGLKLDELESLTHNINSEIEERERVNEKFHKNLDFLKSSVANFDKIQKAFSDSRVTLKTFENVNFSSGKIVAADPICYLLSREINDNLMATIEGIPKGKYPVSFGIIDSAEFGIRMTGMKVSFSNKEAVDYKLCDKGIAVDAGMVTLCDEHAVNSYWRFLENWFEENPDKNFYDDYLADFFKKSYEKYPHLQREGGDFIRYQVPKSDDEIIMVASGFGDGYYPLYLGYAENGELTEVATVFIDLEILN